MTTSFAPAAADAAMTALAMGSSFAFHSWYGTFAQW
jgi:hypothetical protein